MSKISFKFFVESSRGQYGEYINDDVEKYMVVRLINKLLNGIKSEKNYNQVYSFIESDVFEPHYERYYDAHEELLQRLVVSKRDKVSPTSPISKSGRAAIRDFDSNIHKLFERWKKSLNKGSDST